MGAGIAMQPGDIAFKSNFATIDNESGVVLRRRADREFEDVGPILCAALNDIKLPAYPEHRVTVKYATEHRCGIAIAGPGLSDQISGTDPLRDNLPLQLARFRKSGGKDTVLQTVRPLDASVEAQLTAAIVNQLSEAMRATLKDHPINQKRISQGKPPANVVLLRGCGSRIAVEHFTQRHGLRGCMVAPTKIIAGLGMLLGIEVLAAPGATGDYHTQLHAKATAIAEALIQGRYDFAFLHVKAIDDTGHDRAVAMKVKFNEAADQMVLQLIARLAAAEQDGRGPFSVIVTGDHSTPVVFGDHSYEPVPFAVAHIREVSALLGGHDHLKSVNLGPIPQPAPPEEQPPLQLLSNQASLRRRDAAKNMAFRTGDAVGAFDEVSASKGALGRFPGDQVMKLVRQTAGIEMLEETQ